MRLSRPKNGIRCSRICFTVNGSLEYLADAFKKLKTLTPKWIVVGRETCPTTGRLHLQGACVLKKQTAFSVVKSMPGLTGAHIELMKGTPDQSRVYCFKEDKEAYEYGAMPKSGKRNDLHTAIELLREGDTIDDLIRKADTPIIATFVRYPKGLTNVSQVFRSNTHRVPPFVLWMHRATGKGKTRSALDIAKRLGCDGSVWISNGSLQWFDNYNGNKVAIFDDYRTNHAKFSFLLRLLDRYMLSVPYKGGFVNWQPLLLIITTPKSPRATWNLRTEEDIAQLERRVTLSIDYDEHQDEYGLWFLVLLKKFEACVRDGDKFPDLVRLLPGDSTVAPEPGVILIPGSGSESDGELGNANISEWAPGDSPPRFFLDLTQDDEKSCNVESSGQSSDMCWEEDDGDLTSSTVESKDKVFF